MRLATVLGLLMIPLFGCSDTPARGADPWQRVREELAAESADSDVAVILGGALEEAAAAAVDRQADILTRALRQAAAARALKSHPAVPPVESKGPAMPPLGDAKKRILIGKGTEPPFTGKYWKHFDRGVYVCRACGAPLYLSSSKFQSDCGWPSFDDEIPGAVRRQTDADGSRTEILCAACGGHLGHVFEGEGLTPKDLRHCVNSASLEFIPEDRWPLAKALFAGGCFWGVEHYFRQEAGVLGVVAGYAGGHVDRPTYEQVGTGKTGHAEAVEVVFDPKRVSYEKMARLFFEIHDPTERNRQGPDVGSQYRSAVFYLDAEQKRIAETLVAQLKARGYKVVTEVTPATAFWPAEAHHQDYISRHPERACHTRVGRFGS